MMENNNELAKEFAVWCWGKEVSSDVSKIESLFLTFCAEKELKERGFKITEGIWNQLLHRDGHVIQIMKNKEDDIYSVKRLSDNKVFSLCEEVKTNYKQDGNQFINKFILEGNKIIAVLSSGTNSHFVAHRFLNGLSKVKPALFTTLDGVEVFEGDTIFYIFNDLTPLKNAGYVKKWQVIQNKASNGNFGNDYYKVFSTEISAKNYMEENKPQYNLSDIKESLLATLPLGLSYKGWEQEFTENFISYLENGN